MISRLQSVTDGKLRVFSHFEWYLLSAAVTIALLGLVTMHSFSGQNAFFERQVVWIGIAVLVFFATSIPEYRFLQRTPVLVALLSKYFARRHIEIAHIRHILISGSYAFLLSLLVFFQPDLGSAIIIASIWMGVVLVAGISWKHLATLLVIAMLVSGGLWQYGLQPYQKSRVLTFLHPLTDIQGAGYNAYQSMIAVGSGEILGKGVGYGTQSKLRFLPEYETDFIFAAYAEEWGFIGVL